MSKATDYVPGYERLTADELDYEGMFNLLRHLVIISRKDLLRAHDQLLRDQKKRDALALRLENGKFRSESSRMKVEQQLKHAENNVKQSEYEYERSKDFFRSPLFDAISKETTADDYINGLVNGKYELTDLEMN